MTESGPETRPDLQANAAVPSPAPRRVEGRYSRFVSLMKLVLPSIAAILLGLVLVWPQLAETGDRFEVGFATLNARELDEKLLVNPRYYGTDARNRPYTVTADTAQESEGDPELVELEAPKADMTLEDGSWMVVGGRTGFYRKDRETLDLEGDVTVFQDQGYEMHTQRATVDMPSEMAFSDAPTKGHGPFGELTAEGFHVYDKGRTIFFTGRIDAVLRPAATDGGR